MSNKNHLERTRKLVLTALFFAISLVLSLVESGLPPLPIPVPGVKLGLANIAVMYALFFLGRSPALTIAVLKAGFVVLTRGPVAGFLSLCGGALSVAAMAMLMFVFGERISYLLLSVAGAICHNLGQFAAISVVYTGMYLLPYLPVLLVAGVVAGAFTAALLKVIRPAFQRIGLK